MTTAYATRTSPEVIPPAVDLTRYTPDARIETRNGQRLDEFYATLSEQRRLRHDVVAPAKAVAFDPHESGAFTVRIGGVGEFLGGRHFERQVLAQHEIPASYFDRVKGKDPEQAAAILNWHNRTRPTNRLFRTFLPEGGGPGVARAYLSDQFKILDNLEFLETVFTRIGARIEAEEIEVGRGFVGEDQMNLRLLSNRATGEVKKGDLVRLALNVTNSEIGQGALAAELAVERLICVNGMVVPDLLGRVSVRHSGRREGLDDVNAAKILTERTQSLERELGYSKVVDAVEAGFGEKRLEAVVARLREAEGLEVANPEAAAATAVRVLNLPSSFEGPVFAALVASRTVYNAANSITSLAKTAGDYNAQTELERAAGKLVADSALARAVARATRRPDDKEPQALEA